MINRICFVSSSHTLIYTEFNHIKQRLINNGFPKYLFDRQSLKKIETNININNSKNAINLFYSYQIHQLQAT